MNSTWFYVPINSITVDVEDWFHVCGIGELPPVHRSRWRVRANTLRLLDLFDELGIRATFFMLGSVAAAEPELAASISERGHEVASHGYSHRLVHDLKPEQFRDEIVRTSDLIATQTGIAPVGFRAPQWSLGKRTPWAFEILAREGFRYDSSCSPLAFVGDAKGSKEPYLITTGAGDIWEIPPLVMPTGFGNLPVGGGWGLRFFPLRMILGGMSMAHSAGHSAVFFLHPRDIDPAGPRLDLAFLKKFAAYGTRSDVSSVLGRVAPLGKNIPLLEMVESWQSAS